MLNKLNYILYECYYCVVIQLYSSNVLPTDYIMGNLANASKEDVSMLSSHSEQRTTLLSALARIIAKTHLSKTAAYKNGSIEITLPDRQGKSINGVSNGD